MHDEPFVKIAKALADPTRLAMLREIREAGELTCSCVCGRFELSQPTISHHVKILQDAGLVRSRKDGQFHRLTVDERALRAFTTHLAPAKRGRTRTKAAR